MSFLSDVCDLVILNLLYLLCCVPIVTFGVSTVALYRVALNRIQHRSSKVVRPFFAAFRQNWKKGLLTGLLQLVVMAFTVADLYVLYGWNSSLRLPLLTFFLLLTLLFGFVFTYAYPLIAQFENSVTGTIVNGLFLSIRYLPRTVLMVGLNWLPGILLLLSPVLFGRLALFWILIGCALTACINVLLLRKVFQYCVDQQ